MNTTYKSIKESTEFKSDNNACCLVASSIVFNKPFSEMQTFYGSRGRRYKQGTSTPLAYKAIEVLAKNSKRQYKRREKLDIIKLTKGKTMTVNNCTSYLDKSKDYVLFSSSHAVAVKRGKVEDWTKGRKHRIISMYEIEAENEVLQAVKVAPSLSDTLTQVNDLIANLTK